MSAVGRRCKSYLIAQKTFFNLLINCLITMIIPITIYQQQFMLLSFIVSTPIELRHFTQLDLLSSSISNIWFSLFFFLLSRRCISPIYFTVIRPNMKIIYSHIDTKSVNEIQTCQEYSCLKPSSNKFAQILPLVRKVNSRLQYM